MAKQKKVGVLNRLAGKKIVFNGRFEWGQRERLELLAKAHGGTILEDLDASADILVIRDLTAGKTIQAEARKLNAKGAGIQTSDAEGFEKAYEPTDEEIVALIRSGTEGAEIFGIFTGLRRGSYSKTPPRRTIRGERFDGLDLTGFRFGDVAFDACSFIGATLHDTFFSTASGCDFSHAKGETVHFEAVTGSWFVKAKLANVTFHGAIDGLDLSESEMPGLVFWGRLYMGTHRHPSSKMSSGVNFRGGKFKGSKIQPDGGLASPDFEGADISESMLTSCDMESPNFRNAVFQGAMLSETKLRGADFRGADLTDAELAGADLHGALFDGANLKGCNLLNGNAQAQARCDRRRTDGLRARAGGSADPCRRFSQRRTAGFEDSDPVRREGPRGGGG
ncbi:MAG TPA: pentapeptide repeat-containing protein [Tepidisphaeraceae bacterium]